MKIWVGVKYLMEGWAEDLGWDETFGGMVWVKRLVGGFG